MKIKLLKPFFILSSIILSVIIIFSGSICAQGDNPLIDAVPRDQLQNVHYSDSEFDVITVNGYDDFNLGVDDAEVHVSQNPLNPLQYFGAYNINGAWRTGDGYSWLHSAPPFGTSPAGDPCTAYDGAGHLYYETMYGAISGCKVIVSTDNGATWSTSVTSVAGNDKNWMAADRTSGPYANYVYTGMTPGNFARSTNFGATWTTTNTFSTQNVPGFMMCVGPNGTTDGGAVFVVTNSGTTFASTYTFYVSTDGGSTFTLKSSQNFAGYVGTNVSSRHTVQFMRTRPYPFIAADQSNGAYRGRLYLIYASNNPAGNGNKPDIFCRYSTDQGATWSAAITVNDDANSQNNHQWHPATWCDTQTGRLFVSWMDTRDTPTSDSAYIYASYSDNGGVSWTPNQRVSNQKMRICASGVCTPNNANYMGDYFSMTSDNNQSLIMWTDFRSNNFGSYAGYFPDYAMTVSSNSVIIPQNGGSESVDVSVPAVKLFTDDVTFSASVSPIPPTGNITLDFPNGNVLSTFPGMVQLGIQTSGDVTLGSYTITVQGSGPNGTPVHRRTIQLDVIVPVELASFTGMADKNNVVLSWFTATETNNQGFEIQRKTDGEFQKIGFVQGKGTTTEIQNYVFRDENLLSDKYAYRLKQLDFDGSFSYSNEVEIEINQPDVFYLSQNYPNPFNPSTKIQYSIPQDGNVSLKVYDILGKEVATLVNEYQQAGTFDVEFNAASLATGVYYYQLKAGDLNSTKKLMLTK